MSMLKKSYIFAWLLGVLLSYPALSIAGPFSRPQSIPGAEQMQFPTSAGVTASDAITAVYMNESGFIMATWVQAGGLRPTYAIWNGSNWSAAAPISSTETAFSGLPITLTYIPSNETTPETVLATWVDNSSNPFYSVWNNGSWTAPTSIPNASAVLSGFPISAIYAGNGTVVVTWLDSGSSGVPYYAIWDGTTWSSSMSAPTAITSATSASSAVTLAYDVTNNTVLATWVSARPLYSVWNGSSWTTTDFIEVFFNAAPNLPITTTYNPVNGTILATYIANATPGPTYYSIWNGTTWTGPQSIPNASNTSVPTTNIYNAANWTILTFWLDFLSNVPTYSIWDGSSWSSNPEAITGAIKANNSLAISAVYDTAKGTVFTSWLDGNTSYPICSVWDGSDWTLTPQPIPKAAAAISLLPSTTIYNPSNGTTLILWAGSGNYLPMYSIYTPPIRGTR